MNRNVRNFLVAGIIILLFIFLFPLFLSPTRDDYFRTISLLIPIAILLFIAPTASYTLNKWDIHFDFSRHNDAIRPTIANLGITPFNFNRITFASSKKYLFFGKREHYPTDGIFDNDVEYHGADMPSRVLHEHVGCTVRQGMPVTVWIRSPRLAEYLGRFNNKNRIRLCLYYCGTNQVVYSPPISRTLIDNLSRPSAG